MKKGQNQRRSAWNPDVPVETLLKNSVQENKRLHQRIGELESEILYLNNVIHRRDQAISDFKKWQLKIAKLKISEWVSKAAKLVDDPSELERINLVRNAVRNNGIFESMLRKLERSYKLYQDNVNKIIDAESVHKEGGEQ